MFHFLQNRATHSRPWKGREDHPSIDFSFMLKKFKNFTQDEFSTSDEAGMSVPPIACAFAKTFNHGNMMGVVDEDGYIVLYDVNKTGRAAVKDSWQPHSNAIFDLTWAEDDRQIMTSSGDQTIALWEVESRKKIDVFRGHTSSVKSVSIRCGDEAVFASGSRDGHIMLWDKRIFHKGGTIPPVDTIYNAHALQQSNTPGKPRKKKTQPKDGQQSVTAVVFQDNNYLISCGAVDGCVKLWDIRKTYKLFTAGAVPVQVFHYPASGLRRHGFSCLTLDATRSRLFASCTDDNIYEYNMKSAEDKPVHRFRGHKNSTFYVKTAISPDNQFLLSGSSDNHAYVWQINKREAPPLLLKAHDSEVTSVAWCPIDLTKLVTLSDDAKTKFWRIYCREQKSCQLPAVIGRARRLSRERSTSMVDTPPPMKIQLKQNLDTPSPTQSPLNTKTQSTPAGSTPKSLRDWLKRKSTKDADTSEGPSAFKSLCGISGASNSTSDENKTPTSNKRSYGVANENNGASSLSHTTQNMPDCKDSSASVPKRVKISCDSSSVETPDTPKRGKLNENKMKHSSPRKLFKRTGTSLASQEFPTKSPKRPCLTPVKDNGQHSQIVDRTSVKISLFADKNPHENVSSNNPKDSHSIKSKVPSTDVLDTATERRVVSDRINNDNDSSNESTQLSGESITPLKQKLQLCLSDDGEQDSPTRNLPNLVVDQLTNLRPTSPLLTKSSQTKKLDWLTRLKINKGKKENDTSEKTAVSVGSGGVTKSSPKVLKSANMKKIHAYFKAQNDN